MNEIPYLSLEGAVNACKPWAIERRLLVSEPFPRPDCKGFSQEERLGLEVVAACPYGSSSKSRTARVTVRLHDGSLKDYFLRSQESRVKSQESRVKERKREREKERREGREKGIDKEEMDIAYFIVCDFVHSSPNLPSPAGLSMQLARIHQVSQRTDKFGCDEPRHQAGICLAPARYSRWADCFRSLIITFLNQDIAVNEKWPAYEAAFEVLICRTIPRLLLPLQNNGRQILPTLVHGNLSAKHTRIRFSDGMPVLFRPHAMYAHQEYELGATRLAIGGLDDGFINQHLRIVLPSAPIDEVYHRIVLGLFRQSVYNDMLFLNGMYGDK
ncbi:Fructosamine/Ketosamine-3-kinase [Penicillium camemberti]|uniref:Fructosamine/Ketosamine-3-kinase n=1 Tax=Penicillium camemberti (strain FM 013) TaxID=1429867 RepID=A0A0G4PVX2_PENC3|nr:Fructosamine/Ketosamine-3-kinase [Penicillium camemberti]